MHHCLEVNEILDLVFNEVYCNLGPGRNANANLLAIALACQTFGDAALNILWREQPNFVQLIKVLPSRCWQESRGKQFLVKGLDFGIKAKPKADEMSRFSSYARRIRRIKYIPYAHHAEISGGLLVQADIRALRVIWQGRKDKSQPILPNLQYAEFVQADHARQCLDMLLESNGISLCLWLSNPQDDITSLFPIINDGALNMQELDLGSHGDAARVDCRELSDLVCSMAHLRGLACGSKILTPKAIQHLATLPNLRKLQISNTPHDVFKCVESRLSGEKIPSFPDLEQLSIRTTDLASMAQLLHQLRPLRLHALILEYSFIPSEQELRKIFIALEQASNHLNLQIIKMKYIDINPRRRRSVFNPRVIVNGFTLEPLFAFKNLHTVELDIPCGFRMDDFTIESLSKAWPHLRRLQLGSPLGWYLSPLVTFSGILLLLEHCPELEHLALSLDGSSKLPSVLPKHMNPNITYLYLGNSSLPARRDEYPIAAFLKQLFPNLCGIGGAWLYGEVEGAWQVHTNKNWDKIVSFMKEILLSDSRE